MTEQARVVIFREEGMLLAVCLERNIGVQGRDIAEVCQRLRTACQDELDDGNMANIEPAPKRYHDMWNLPDTEITRGTIAWRGNKLIVS